MRPKDFIAKSIVYYAIAIICLGCTGALAQDAPPAQEAEVTDPPPLPFVTTSEAPNLDKMDFVERPEDSLFILELATHDGFTLDRSLLVYLDGDDVLVPLSKVLAAVQFPIEVDVADGKASGWFIDKANTFALEYPFKTVTIKGEKEEVSGIVERHIDDIYVSTTELSHWFPVSFTLNFNELRLYLSSSEELPFQEAAERTSRWESLSAKKKDKDATADDQLKGAIFLPYKELTFPTVQLSHSLSASKSGAGGQTNSGTTTSLQSYNDMLWHTAHFNANITKQSQESENASVINNVLFNMSRQDVRGNLLGPMKATEYEFGDIGSYSFPLASGYQRGRGAKVSNAPPNYVRDPDSFVIEGYATTGWDVEVYQDETLLNFQKVDADGRYRFEDIELRQGFNLFRLVLYGPNGEKEERYERYYLGQDMVSPGEFIYQMSALESSTPLFNFENQKETSPTFSFLGEYGVTENISAYGGVFSGPLSDDSDMNGIGTGVRFSLGPTYTQLGVLQDVTGARSIGLNTTGNITNTISLSAGHTENTGFDKDVQSVARETYVRLSKLFSLMKEFQGSYSLEGKRATLESGVIRDRLTNRLSLNVAGINFTNELEYEKTDSDDSDDLGGNLTMAQRLPFGNLRGRLNYELKPINEIVSGEVQFQTDLDEKTTLGLGMTKEFMGDKMLTFRTSLDRMFDKFRLGLNGEVTTENDIMVGLNLTYNLVPRSLQGDYYMTSSSNSLTAGQVQIIPFIDENGNKTYDDNETTVPEVMLRNLSSGTKATSDEKGYALLEGINANSINKITVDTKSLPEIYMIPAIDDMTVFGKTGTAGPLYYPIELLGEVTGTLYRTLPDGEKEALSDVEIMLVDQNDKVVAQTYSEYDGFFTFQSLQIGQYKLYLPPSSKLEGVYSGSGDGPAIALDASKAQISDVEVVVGESDITASGL